jgi:hypothetical protein
MLPGAKRETPFQWTMVEAMHLAAACPTHLERLYQAVTDAGYGAAANQARDKIDAIAKDVGVPLT